MNLAGRATSGLKAFSTVWLALAGIALASTLNAKPIPANPQYALLVADSQATIYSVNPKTGERAIIAQGGLLSRPYDLAVKQDGTIAVSDTFARRIVQVNPATQEQHVIADGDELGVPYGLTLDRQNVLYVANASSVLRINPKNGRIETLATGGLLRVPMDVAAAADGNVYVADAVAGIIRVNPATGKQTLIASGNMLHQPVGIVLDGGYSAYVADLEGRCIVTVDLRNGTQNLVSMAGLLTSPVGIAIGPDGALLVSDPDAFNLDGGIMTINADGSQNQIAQGSGDLVNSRGIAVYPLSQKFPQSPLEK